MLLVFHVQEWKIEYMTFTQGQSKKLRKVWWFWKAKKARHKGTKRQLQIAKYTVACALSPPTACLLQFRNPANRGPQKSKFRDKWLDVVYTSHMFQEEDHPSHTPQSALTSYQIKWYTIGYLVVFSPSSKGPGITLSRRQDIRINRSLFPSMRAMLVFLLLHKDTSAGKWGWLFHTAPGLVSSSPQWLLLRVVPLLLAQLGKRSGPHCHGETAFSFFLLLMFTMCY